MSERTRVEQTDVEFTLDWYRRFLRRLRSEGYRFGRFGDHEDGCVLLRHDVDLSVPAALEMARVESSLDVTSTYLFLLTSPLYNVFESRTRKRVEEIASLGHDVGLHFSTHAYWPADDPPGLPALVDRTTSERSVLEGALDAEVASTVSFHIPPDWVLDRRIPGVQSAYAPAYFSEMGYVADSGQRWREEPPSIGELPPAVQVLTHPGLWGEEDASFEHCVDEAVREAAGHAREHARREFLAGVED